LKKLKEKPIFPVPDPSSINERTRKALLSFEVIEKYRKYFQSIYSIIHYNEICPELEEIKNGIKDYEIERNNKKGGKARIDKLRVLASLLAGIPAFLEDYETQDPFRKIWEESSNLEDYYKLNDDEIKFLNNSTILLFITRESARYLAKFQELLSFRINFNVKKNIIWIVSKASIENYVSSKKIITLGDLWENTNSKIRLLELILTPTNYKISPNKKYTPEMFDKVISEWLYENKKKYVAIDKILQEYGISHTKSESFRKALDKYLKSTPNKKLNRIKKEKRN